MSNARIVCLYAISMKTYNANDYDMFNNSPNKVKQLQNNNTLLCSKNILYDYCTSKYVYKI